MAKTTCGHLICEVAGSTSCKFGFDRSHYGMGGPVAPLDVPAERVAKAQRLLGALRSNREAVRAELARQQMLADVEELLELVAEEQQQCLRTQSGKSINERAAKLFDVIRDFTLEGDD